ncbi:MAG: Dyp-type peroxidase [Pontimonas sp.]
MSERPEVSRRAFLGGSAALGLIGLGSGAGWTAHAASPVTTSDWAGWGYTSVVPFYGSHQAGIISPPTAHARYLVFDLKPDTSRSDIARLLMVITEDAARLVEGVAPLADSEPELSRVPAHLTITVGFGQELVRRVNPLARPRWLAPLPTFDIDNLHPRLTGGDLLVIVQADDPLTVSHASRVLTRQTRSLVGLRWSRDGFRRAKGAESEGATMRNLFGQVDGTATPLVDEPSFQKAVWGDPSTNPAWLKGGTGYALRVIDMDVETWDEVDRPDRERSVGRRLDTGAPLTGSAERDVPDFGARDTFGLPVIPDFSHMRRARANAPEEVFHRRGYNYEIPHTDGTVTAGQLFEAFAHDPVRQFVPVQRRLAEADMMNLWTTPVGSGVFALPPGCRRGGFIGDTLFS